jgi:putative endonuclease
MFYVYALYNKVHSKIYIGQTDNLEERLRLHKEKYFKTSYTAKLDGNWDLIYKEEHETRIEALKREKQLKSFRGREFVKKFIPL